MKQLLKYIFLFLVGGSLYYIIEILYRGYSHITMLCVGGICFILVGLINEILTYEMSLLKQALIACTLVTEIEFVSGMILNKMLHLNIWDYSNLRFNFMGQICLRFSIMWFFLSIVAIIVDDYIRHIFFGEEKPKYHLIE